MEWPKSAPVVFRKANASFFVTHYCTSTRVPHPLPPCAGRRSAAFDPFTKRSVGRPTVGVILPAQRAQRCYHGSRGHYIHRRAPPPPLCAHACAPLSRSDASRGGVPLRALRAPSARASAHRWRYCSYGQCLIPTPRAMHVRKASVFFYICSLARERCTTSCRSLTLVDFPMGTPLSGAPDSRARPETIFGGIHGLVPAFWEAADNRARPQTISRRGLGFMLAIWEIKPKYH